jgi:hypothetical protein
VVHYFTELYRTLLTFVANRSNVAGFCGVLEESEIKQLEQNDITERSGWLAGCTDSHIRCTRRKNSRMQHAFALRCCCGIYLLNDSFDYTDRHASSTACVQSMRLEISKPREMFGTTI